MRVFDLIGAARGPLLSVLSGGPLTIPGSVSPDDQEAVIALLQARGAQHPLRRVELDVPHGLTAASARLLEKIAEGGWGDDALLVLRRALPETLRAVLADPRVRRFPRVVGVVAHPGGDEDLSAWGELTRVVRDALHAVFIERAVDLGVSSGALDAWRPFFDTLTNPCALVRVANDVVEESYLTPPESPCAGDEEWEGDPSLRLSERVVRPSRVARGLVLHELAWRPWSEVLVLIALATGSTQRSEKILGAETQGLILLGLEAQGVWHEADGLRDWATRLETDEGWRNEFGEARPLPTAQQRADGWDTRCDDLCAEIAYMWFDPILPEECSRFTGRLDELHQALTDQRPEEELRPLLDELAQRAPSEANTSGVRVRYLYELGRAALRRGDFPVSISVLEEALRLSNTSMSRTRLLVQSRLGSALKRAGEVEAAIALLERAAAEGRTANAPLHLAELLFYLAEAYFGAKNSTGERGALKECAELEARHGATYASRARTLRLLGYGALQMGVPEEALQQGLRAVEYERRLLPASEPGLSEALWLVCLAHILLLQRVAAKEALEELFQLAARHDSPPRRLVERIRNAVTHFRTRFRSSPDAFTEELARLEARAAPRD